MNIITNCSQYCSFGEFWNVKFHKRISILRSFLKSGRIRRESYVIKSWIHVRADRISSNEWEYKSAISNNNMWVTQSVCGFFWLLILFHVVSIYFNWATSRLVSLHMHAINTIHHHHQLYVSVKTFSFLWAFFVFLTNWFLFFCLFLLLVQFVLYCS